MFVSVVRLPLHVLQYIYGLPVEPLLHPALLVRDQGLLMPRPEKSLEKL